MHLQRREAGIGEAVGPRQMLAGLTTPASPGQHAQWWAVAGVTSPATTEQPNPTAGAALVPRLPQHTRHAEAEANAQAPTPRTRQAQAPVFTWKSCH